MLGVDFTHKESGDKPFGSNIIKLNVGGKVFQTTLETLRKEPSNLCKMFSGSGFLVEKDGDGSYFIDRPGKYFGYVLEYLQTGAFIPPEDKRTLKCIENEVAFYQIPSLLKILRPPFIKFDYFYQSDKRGIIYWIGTNFGSEEYINPYLRKLVRISFESSPQNNNINNCQGSHEKESVVQHYDSPVDPPKKQEISSAVPKNPSLFVITITLPFCVVPSCYSLCGGLNCLHAVNWRLEGSSGGSWQALNAQKSLLLKGCWETTTQEQFNQFRLVSTANRLCIHGFEVYGKVVMDKSIDELKHSKF